MSFAQFHPVVRQWFSTEVGQPTRAQLRGWTSIRQRRATLIAAPTGSGKTFAAFLSALDELFCEGLAGRLADEVRVLYVSPLKALSADILKNLADPRRGIRRAAEESGLHPPRMTAAVRTGDTTQSERAAMLRTPPHILVTTPESLYLLLTAERSRQMLRTVRTVIVDEIHAVIGTRRGAHLALSLERLRHVADAPLLRIGLSATQKPIAEVARFLVGTGDGDGPAPACDIVDEGHQRDMDLDVEVPRSPLDTVMSSEVWEEYYDRLAELVEAHKTTLVFVNTRRMAERLARHLSERLGTDAVTAHHGSLSREKRLDAETRLKSGHLRALVATASLELGIDIGHVDLVCQIGSPRRIATLLQRVGRSGHTLVGTPKGRVFPTSRDDLLECAALLRAVRLGGLDAIVNHDAPLDVLAQQLVAESACREWAEDDLYALVQRAWPYRELGRKDFDAVLTMTAGGFATRRGRRAALIHRDEVSGTVRARRGARLLAQTSGGAIPEVADYRVVLEPEETLIGTVNEDFAIESMVGDVFQLGNASWRVLQVSAGTVRVADAAGTPPNIPFWFGEAPARSDELSAAVSGLRAELDARIRDAEAARTPPGGGALGPAAALAPVLDWLADETALPREAAEQIVSYVAEGRRMLGVIPTQQTLVLERFFDESGGMQLVLHAPFGSRVNKAWGLALRKRFCRQFNFELQAAATDDAVLLSLGPQHSFPLADVFRYLHPDTTRDVLVQAFLDAPVFPTRWRWNATIALAVPRSRAGRKVAPQVQRMLAEDLLAAVFPDAAACLENIPGDRQIPDHPLVNQTVRDCLEEAMDCAGLQQVLHRIRRGALRLVARDTPEPSLFAYDILNARPYAFLDDAPLEERRAHAVQSRRAGEPSRAADLGALDPAAIERVRDQARPAPRDADELHDALMTAGFLTADEIAATPREFLEALSTAGRATRVVLPTGECRDGSIPSDPVCVYVAAERLPEMTAVHPHARIEGGVEAPPARAARAWTREEAMIELLRGRLTIIGPTTAEELAASVAVGREGADDALLALESDGVVLRGRFRPLLAGRAVEPGLERVSQGTADVGPQTEWCDRALLARIHRYTLNRLRAEIEPVSPADFMRFLFRWQHVAAPARVTGLDGLRDVIAMLDGFELPAAAWERSVLPMRVDGYDPSLLDMLCLAGEAAWGRFSPPRWAPGDSPRLVPATPVALCLREHAAAWCATLTRVEAVEAALKPAAVKVLHALRTRGASFLTDLGAACALAPDAVREAMGALVAGGLARSDGFAGLRALLWQAAGRRPWRDRRAHLSGRWTAVTDGVSDVPHEDAAEIQAAALLRRYGVVFRRLLMRETSAVPWRDLVRVYRRLEARGEIRGGRFVSGMSGEQFATAEAVVQLREGRRMKADGQLIAISTADPLNLAGIVTPGERIRAAARNRIVYRDGLPLAALEGDVIREFAPLDTAMASEVARMVHRRRIPAVLH
jgi:ATP-dependent Lhr-like helicase